MAEKTTRYAFESWLQDSNAIIDRSGIPVSGTVSLPDVPKLHST
jgi:hypothetical protein